MVHNWKIYNLKRTISDGIVFEVIYGCESSHENFLTRKIETLFLSGSIDGDNFITYENLTETDILGWVDSNVDKSSIETANSSSIAEDILAKAAITEIDGVPWEDN